MSSIANNKVSLQYDQAKVSSQLRQLTLEEKALLTGGDGFATTVGIPRLGIPSLKMVEGVNGVKDAMQIDSGDTITDVLAGNGPTTFCFPSTSCFGATWNTDLLYRLGQALGSQAREKDIQLVLGPGVNMHRDPRGGRNFEYFSEDPYLSGRLGAAITNGIQSMGIGACSKHLLANDGEDYRRKYDVVDSLDSRAIREVSMAAFQELLRTSNPVMLMMGYNKIEGKYCAESRMIEEIIRKDWGYDGTIMSDWFGTVSTVAGIEAGLDLEMPGPPIFRGQKLVKAVQEGRITEAQVGKRASKMLELINKTTNPNLTPSFTKSETKNLARQVAMAGIVLLKNDQETLPLSFKSPLKIAIVGLHGIDPPMNGGGSSLAPPQYLHTPMECIQALHSHPDLVKFAGGVKCNKILPLISPDITFAQNGENGVDVEYFNDSSPNLVLKEFQVMAQIAMLGFVKPRLDNSGFRYEISTSLRPKTGGCHTLGVLATGGFQMFIDGVEILSVPSIECIAEDYLFAPSKLEKSCKHEMKAGQSYSLKVIVKSWKSAHPSEEPSPHLAKLCFQEEFSDDAAIDEAVTVAQSCDVSIIFAGRNAEYESEGFDQDDIFLPGAQAKMVKRVAETSKKTVLVIYSGGPIDVSAYIDDIDALIHASYLGQEGAAALADIISGAACPSGKLATTWPKRIEDVSTFEDFPATKKGDNIDVHLVEGVAIGYRRNWPVAPRYDFGFGLSYTAFKCSGLEVTPHQISLETSEIVVRVEVENIGKVAGAEVLQVYVSDPECSISRPARELKGFVQVMLEPGASSTVTISLDTKSALSFWDETSLSWKAEKGQFCVTVGGQSCSTSLAESFSWKGL